MAGFWAGFGEQFSTNVEQRQKTLDRLIEENLDNARRVAPKYAQVKAEARNSASIMKEMQSEFDVTPEEFIALAQNYDINAVYKTIQQTKAKLPEGQTLSKDAFLGSLNIPEGVTLPEGMTPEQALEGIYFGYARNLNKDPDNKSEVHQSQSWAKAVKDVLMLNPQASAEEQVNAMSVMGVPVQDLLQFQASATGGYKPLQGVERVGGFDIDVTDYKERDYMSTANTYERTFTRTFAGTDDLANVTDMAGALKAIGVKDEAELGNRLRKGGTAIADLELGLSQAGVQSKLERDRTLLRLSNEVNTSAEMDTLISAIENGTAQELILESMQKNGRLTNDYIEYILTGTMPTEEDQIVEGPTLTPESDDLEQAVAAQEGDAEPAEAGTGDATVDAILNNATAEDDEEETATAPSGIMERPEGSIAAKEYESAAEFIQDNDQRILDELESKGLTGESSKDEIKRALADFYRANQDDPTIGNYIANAPMQDIDRIADVFMLTLKQLEEQE